jgi:hypothetical protein
MSAPAKTVTIKLEVASSIAVLSYCLVKGYLTKRGNLTVDYRTRADLPGHLCNQFCCKAPET